MTGNVRYSWSSFEEIPVLQWALAFFIVAIIAAIFGFGGIAAGAAGIAKFVFFLFLLAFLVSLIAGVTSNRRPPL